MRRYYSPPSLLPRAPGNNVICGSWKCIALLDAQTGHRSRCTLPLRQENVVSLSIPRTTRYWRNRIYRSSVDQYFKFSRLYQRPSRHRWEIDCDAYFTNALWFENAPGLCNYLSRAWRSERDRPEARDYVHRRVDAGVSVVWSAEVHVALISVMHTRVYTCWLGDKRHKTFLSVRLITENT